jgi:hypothetical protein
VADLTDDEIRALMERSKHGANNFVIQPLAEEVLRLRAELKEAVALLLVSDLSAENQRETNENGAYAAYDERRDAFLAKHNDNQKVE